MYGSTRKIVVTRYGSSSFVTVSRPIGLKTLVLNLMFPTGRLYGQHLLCMSPTLAVENRGEVHSDRTGRSFCVRRSTSEGQFQSRRGITYRSLPDSGILLEHRKDLSKGDLSISFEITSIRVQGPEDALSRPPAMFCKRDFAHGWRRRFPPSEHNASKRETGMGVFICHPDTVPRL